VAASRQLAAVRRVLQIINRLIGEVHLQTAAYNVLL
jgi:hypothetical protein